MIKHLISFALFFFPFITLGAEFIEGRDYQVIQSSNQDTYKSGPVHVTEFFSYGCPWCYRLDSAVYQWTVKQGKSIQFTKVPVVFNQNWDTYAKAFYIIDSMSLDKTVNDNLFKTIIVDKQPLDKQQELIEFFKKNGVDASIVESALTHSPSIDLRLKADEALMAKYQINAVPTLVVNNQYKTNLQMAKSEDRLFKILDYLLSEVKKNA